MRLTEAQQIQRLIDKPVKLIDSIHAEQELLRALVQDTSPEHLVYSAAISGGIQDRDFTPTSDWHRPLWLAVEGLIKRNRPVTQATLLSYLRQHPMPNPVDYERLLGELYAQPAREDLIQTHIDEVKQAGLQRYVQVESLTLAHSAQQMTSDRISSRLAKISEQSATTRHESTSLSDGVELYREHLNGRLPRALEGKGARLALPLHELNEAWAGGFEPGRYYLLGGPPKAGKTKLATWMIWQLMYRCGAVVDWFSTEMTLEMTIASLLGPAAGLPFRQAFALEPSNDDVREAGGDRPRAVAALAKSISDGMRILTNSGGDLHHRMVGGEVSVRAIESTVKRRLMEMSARGDHRPYMVVVDYVQGLSTGDNLGSERDEIRNVSLALNALAKQKDVPILGLYHTNRNDPLQAYGSAQLEKDGDVTNVITIREDMAKNHRELVTTYSRHHEPGRIELDCDLARARFTSWQQEQTHRRAR